MRTKYEYLVMIGDDMISDHFTRESARKSLKMCKADGFTEAKIYQQEYVFIKSKQVR